MTSKAETPKQMQAAERARAILGPVMVVIALAVGVAIVATTLTSKTTHAPVAPPGDYGEICRLFKGELEDLGQSPDLDQFAAFYVSIDFEPLIAAAPKGLVPTIEILRDSRAEIRRRLSQVQTARELGTDDLPADFLEALETVGTALTHQCNGATN